MELPEVFIQSLQNVKGFSKEAFKTVHQSGEQITSIRINPSKQIQNQPANTNPKIPWCQNGFYLSERPSFTLDPIFHAGGYYVQEASSMFLEEAVKQTVDLSKPLKVLDLCAAPGGKSTLIQSLLNNYSLLVSNEVIKTRVNILTENISKWGVANVVVTNNDPKDFQRLPGYFDVLVVDAPCSGSGLFRKDPAAITEWSLQNVQLCSQRQQRILADIWPSLKEGGVLIYSTCSYSTEEDEAITNWVIDELKAESIQLMIEESWGIIETTSVDNNAYGYRFYPDKVKGEGFFIAAFKKIDAVNNDNKKLQVKNKLNKIISKETAMIAPYLSKPADYFYFKQKEDVVAMPIQFEIDLLYVQSHLYIKKAGVKLGQFIREELIPDHQFALSTMQHTSIPTINTDQETALQYLRKHEINISTHYKGWAMLTYMSLPLGWIKILSNRINNYYPKEWRILHK